MNYKKILQSLFLLQFIMIDLRVYPMQQHQIEENVSNIAVMPKEDTSTPETMKNLFLTPEINAHVIDMLTGVKVLQLRNNTADSTSFIKKELITIERAAWHKDYESGRNQAFRKLDLYRFLFPQLRISANFNLINNYRTILGQEILLHQAVNYSNTQQVIFLLDHGADIEILDSNGKTALCRAADQKNEGMMQLLISRGANISLLSYNPHSYYGD